MNWQASTAVYAVCMLVFLWSVDKHLANHLGKIGKVIAIVMGAGIIIGLGMFGTYKEYKSEQLTSGAGLKPGSKSVITLPMGVTNLQPIPAVPGTVPQVNFNGQNAGIIALQTNPTNSPITQNAERKNAELKSPQ